MNGTRTAAWRAYADENGLHFHDILRDTFFDGWDAREQLDASDEVINRMAEAFFVREEGNKVRWDHVSSKTQWRYRDKAYRLWLIYRDANRGRNS